MGVKSKVNKGIVASKKGAAVHQLVSEPFCDQKLATPHDLLGETKRNKAVESSAYGSTRDVPLPATFVGATDVFRPTTIRLQAVEGKIGAMEAQVNLLPELMEQIKNLLHHITRLQPGATSSPPPPQHPQKERARDSGATPEGRVYPDLEKDEHYAPSGERYGNGIKTDTITTPVVNTSAYWFKNCEELIDFKATVLDPADMDSLQRALDENKVIAGCVSGSEEMISKVRQYHHVVGGVLDPNAAYMVSRGVKMLHLRVQYQNSVALRMAQVLEDRPKIIRVYYPGLASHPEHHIAKQQMTGFGGVVSFEVAGGLLKTTKFIDSLKIPYLAPSFGGCESIVDPPAIMSYWDSKSERAKYGIGDNLVRFSFGLEGFEG